MRVLVLAVLQSKNGGTFMFLHFCEGIGILSSSTWWCVDENILGKMPVIFVCGKMNGYFFIVLNFS